MSDEQTITVENTKSYGHNTTIHYRGTMQVEYILDLVPGAFHQPEDLVRWMSNHPYITKVTYTPKAEPKKLAEFDMESNIKSLICELAERETITAMANEVIHVTAENGDVLYTDEAQDVFNDLYDELEELVKHHGLSS